MILLCGIPSETPLAMVASELERHGEPVVMFNQREFATTAMEFELVGGRPEGTLTIDGTRSRLADFCGVFIRLMDDRFLPELDDEPEESPQRATCRDLHETLIQWFEIAPTRVVNRYGPMGSNGSKPYQAQLIMKHGFRTPETLITNDVEEVAEFRRRHGRVIYKSASGSRSIVTELTDEDLDRVDSLRVCPTQFQQRVDGQDVRVHVIGGEVFATAISSDGVDYRYAHQTAGGETSLTAIELPDHIAGRVVDLADDLGLAFAGVDLMIDTDGEVYCFEVNPSPAFSYYEQHTGQPIARAVARFLVEGATGA